MAWPSYIRLILRTSSKILRPTSAKPCSAPSMKTSLLKRWRRLIRRVQKSIVESLDSERAAEIVEEMDPDAAADLLADLPQDRTEEILVEMEPRPARRWSNSSNTARRPPPGA